MRVRAALSIDRACSCCQKATCRLARSAKRHLRASQALFYRVTGGVAVPALLAGAVAIGCAAAVPPTVEPGCCVGFSVPAAFGKLFDGSGVDWLELPAGGL